jgi:DNA polymerase-3 subunit chi
MTRIDFHSNVSERLSYVCRLVRKAYGAGNRVVIHGAREELDKLDGLLWSFSQLDFLPHCSIDASQEVLDVTPIVLADTLEAVPHHDLLINLLDETPALFARFSRLIEVIGRDETALGAGRQRYKFYRDHGYPLTHHTME